MVWKGNKLTLDSPSYTTLQFLERVIGNNRYFGLLNCLQNGYQNRVKIQKNTGKSKELPTRLAGRAAAGQPGE